MPEFLDTPQIGTDIDPLLLRRLAAGLPPLVPAGLTLGRTIPSVAPAVSAQPALTAAPAAGSAAGGTPYLRTPELRSPTPAAGAGTPPAGLTPAAGLPSLRPATLAAPDPNDPRYQLHGLKKVGIGILGAMEGLGGDLDSARALNPYQRALTTYNRNVEQQKTQLGMEDTRAQIEERRAQGARADAAANKPESLDQELAVATMNAIRAGGDPAADPKVKQLIAVKNEAADKIGGPKVKDVKTDEQGNAIAVMEDGTTKALGFKAGRESTGTGYEHATIADPKNPGKPKEALFDRGKGQYLDVDTKQPIAGARPYEKPEKPDKTKTPGEDAFARGLAENSVKDIATARGADFKYRTMTDSYPRALKGDQQAMLNLLTNHIGMTLGLQKGARITKDILNEAQQSAPWLQKVKAKFDGQGYLSGVTLTPEQMQSMMDLAKQQRGIAWDQARDSAKQAGVESQVQFPADISGSAASAPATGDTKSTMDALRKQYGR